MNGQEEINGGNGNGNGGDNGFPTQTQTQTQACNVSLVPLIIAIVALALGLFGYAIYDCGDAGEVKVAHAALAKVVGTKANTADVDAALLKKAGVDQLTELSDKVNTKADVDAVETLNASLGKTNKAVAAQQAATDKLSKSLDSVAQSGVELAESAQKLDARMTLQEGNLKATAKSVNKIAKAQKSDAAKLAEMETKLKRAQYAARKAKKEAEDARRVAADANATATTASSRVDALATPPAEEEPPKVRVTLRVGDVPAGD